MFTANIYTPLEGNGSNTTMPLKVFTHRLFQKRMQSSKIFEAFLKSEDKDKDFPRGQHWLLPHPNNTSYNLCQRAHNLIYTSI